MTGEAQHRAWQRQKAARIDVAWTVRERRVHERSIAKALSRSLSFGPSPDATGSTPTNPSRPAPSCGARRLGDAALQSTGHRLPADSQDALASACLLPSFAPWCSLSVTQSGRPGLGCPRLLLQTRPAVSKERALPDLTIPSAFNFLPRCIDICYDMKFQKS